MPLPGMTPASIIPEWVLHPTPEDWARDLVAAVGDWLAGFSVIDWVLVALAMVALYWLWASLHSITRLGPIEVELLEQDGDAKLDVHALTAALRERLAHSGLSPPPAVPAGTPQANLIAAVKATPIPEANWIATLLDLLPDAPQPPRYRLSGTLRGGETADSTAVRAPYSGSPRCGISFWLRPAREGKELLRTIDKQDSHEQAVECAASRIYLHISNDAVGAFPVWARWQTEKGLEAFLNAYKKREDRDIEGAVEELETAVRHDPVNALAQLQLANFCEQLAPRGDGRGAKTARATMQARALRQYLDIASEWPALVEARYRASILAGTLATTSAQLYWKINRDTICHQLRLSEDIDSAQKVPQRLRDIAARESAAARQLLNPWYILVRERRFRNQFEPKAYERRQLSRTVTISKHCLCLRSHGTRRDWWIPLDLVRREAAVHYYHMFLGRNSVSWQTHYTVACFDALLLARLRAQEVARLRAQEAQVTPGEPMQDAAAATGRPGPATNRRKDRLRRRAFRHLNQAVRDANEQLSRDWVLAGDPDLESLRDSKDWHWQLLQHRRGGPARSLPFRYPARPWGDAALRRDRWFRLFPLSWVVFAFFFQFLPPSSGWDIAGWTLLVLFIALSGRQAYIAAREARLSEAEGEPSPPS